MDIMNYLPWLTSNCETSDLGLPSSWDYRHKSLMPISNFKLQNILLLTVVTMLHDRSLEHVPLTDLTEIWII
jgi:hypothetical protein